LKVPTSPLSRSREPSRCSGKRSAVAGDTKVGSPGTIAWMGGPRPERSTVWADRDMETFPAFRQPGDGFVQVAGRIDEGAPRGPVPLQAGGVHIHEVLTAGGQAVRPSTTTIFAGSASRPLEINKRSPTAARRRPEKPVGKRLHGDGGGLDHDQLFLGRRARRAAVVRKQPSDRSEGMVWGKGAGPHGGGLPRAAGAITTSVKGRAIKSASRINVMGQAAWSPPTSAGDHKGGHGRRGPQRSRWVRLT